MMRNRTINFAKSDARPEDIKGTIGVSDRFADPKLKEAIAEQMRAPQAPAGGRWLASACRGHRRNAAHKA